jgi:cytochrome c biogenesis protein CcmG, thiol:disulfide interchange protein DsbE
LNPPLYIVTALLLALAALAGAEIAWQLAGRAGLRRRVGLRVSASGAALLAVAVAGFVACLHLTGRLGVEQLWFRAPAFYVAVALLLGALAAWFRFTARPWVRFGIPAAGFAIVAMAMLALRAHGSSTPVSMLLPSLRRAAPELTWSTMAGEAGSIHDLEGKVVLVNFWATWCAPCRLEMPMLSALQARYADRGLVVVYLSLEEREVVEPFLRAHPLVGTAARLTRAADYYQAGKFYPITYLFSRDGSVEKRWSGRPTEKWLTASIEAQL